MNKMYPINENTSVRVNDAVGAALRDPEYIRKHLHLVVRRQDGEVTEVLRKEFLNVNLEMRVRLDMIGDFDQCSADAKVTKSLLELIELSEKDAWNIALENTAAESIISTMGTLFPMEMTEDPVFWICTTKSNIDGAAALATTAVFKDFCEDQDVDACAILPSSRHELLLLPEKEPLQWSYKELAELVDFVNGSGIVSSDIKLDSVVYRYNALTDSIYIAAKAM